MSKWAKEVSAKNALPEYPRLQMVRKDWMNLNGQWKYAIRPKSDSQPKTFDGHILVPFCVESALSGVQKAVGEDKRLWYKRSFDIPKKWSDKRILLHFGAVDWETNVWVNGKHIGSHRGGYDRFSFDITDALNNDGTQEIVVSVWDPADEGYQPRGKQVQEPRGIWYTSVTGIWQTVWLEPVNVAYIKSIKIVPDIDAEVVRITALCSELAADYTVETEAKDGWLTKGKGKGQAGQEMVIPISKAKLWSPDRPFLYDLKVTLKDSDGKKVDEVSSYFGMRKISLGKDKDGITRMMLNNEFVFQFGLLDQGWWPDGLYTAPTDKALRYDIEVTKKLGLNLARKHVKIEPARWYYWCDRLGLLVWQDMPSGDEYIDRDEPDIQRSRESAEQFKLELTRMIDNLRNHPSIIVWVPYNEGWGQYDTPGISRMIKEYDPSRLVNSASGWADRGVGDIHDIHAYPGPAMPEPEARRAIVLGEFGGLGLAVEGHTWQERDNWGYRNFRTTKELTNAYEVLIGNLYPMINKGLSAAVYTQTTDVEIEVNGMMTYDRAVIKMETRDVRRINREYLAPIIQSGGKVFLE
ncbi:MAG: beta galactosidase jelly roll domain-containing protein [Planctomycetota bacterium]|nr:MAG: beta galactosidase jelly roll domain-containing protein [Planctomycetota bacterium]